MLSKLNKDSNLAPLINVDNQSSCKKVVAMKFEEVQ